MDFHACRCRGRVYAVNGLVAQVPARFLEGQPGSRDSMREPRLASNRREPGPPGTRLFPYSSSFFNNLSFLNKHPLGCRSGVYDRIQKLLYFARLKRGI